MGKIPRSVFLVIVWFSILFFIMITKSAYADESDVFTSNLKANILFIIGNSNNFDEDFVGNSICSWRTGSRSVESRRVLTNIVNTYANKLRFGIMTFQLPSANQYYLHNSPYFVSYDSRSYCPSPPAECSDYCTTNDAGKQGTCQTACSAQNSSFDANYRDEIITNSPVGSEQRNRYCDLIYPKKNRYTNPTDPSNYIYYNLPGTMYANDNYGTAFCYSNTYNPDETNTDSYNCYFQKTGTDDNEVGYSGYYFSSGFSPTDEDIALGFRDFGSRLAWYYSGRTWFANSSPGKGYLHVACNDNLTDNNQLNALLAKLVTNENNESGYMSCTNAANPNACSYIINAGLTPTAGTFKSALDYFRGHSGYTSPVQGSCQKNFIVFLTNGLPNVNESGGTDTATNLLPAVLSKIDALRALAINGNTFDIQTYILGMGLTSQDKVKLDSMAVHGGTAINGHAYYADDPAALTAALNAITSDIISKVYSFSIASVSANRIPDENFLYEASFMPTNADPFWQGFLKKYNINADGTLGSVIWDAGEILQATTAGSRKIMTYKAGSLTSFTPSNITASDLGVSTDSQRDAVVGFIRGESSYNPENWKLGDIYHSTPITVGTPNPYYRDNRDQNNAFATYRANHVRTSASGYRLIVAGANDGQIHAFSTGTGAEVWSFIPPNLLPKLNSLAHTSNPSTLPHQYFVDGPVTVADVWLGAGDGKSKSSSDWKTILIFGEGRGGGSNLWSSSSSCDSNFSSVYTSTYTYYCGYYSFNLENSLSPSFKWLLSPTAGQASYLGEPWSRMMIGRVRHNGGAQDNEKWVGFIGAGYNIADCHGGGNCDSRGKGFYVVDLSNGQILWSYTFGDDHKMGYSIPAAPAIVDTDNDGFIDTAYIGDLGGNVWRFNFCTANDMPSCGISNWSGRRLFESSGGNIRPIYTIPAITKDQLNNLWVYWGTGDKMNPNTSNVQERFFAIKDNDRTTTYKIHDLVNVTSSGNTLDFTSSSDKGYYINLSENGEKILADPVVFGFVAYFTTYTPSTEGGICAQSGSASLYAINSKTGGGALSNGSRSMGIGTGIASTPLLSMQPTGSGSLIPDLYATVSGGGGVGASTGRVNINPPGLSNRTNILHWRDRRF